jgi:hypothetical protein
MGGFLYKTDSAHYQLLVPANINVYWKHANPNRDSGLFLNAALLGTLLGWGGHSSAGHVIKDYICQRLLEDDQFNNWEAISECKECPKQDEYLTNNMLAGIEPTKLTNRFFHQTKDCSLNGVFVGVDPNNDNQVHLHVLQIKSGGSRRRSPSGPQASEKKNNKMILRIITKAQLGFERLFETLQRPTPKKAADENHLYPLHNKGCQQQHSKDVAQGVHHPVQRQAYWRQVLPPLHKGHHRPPQA